MLDDHRDFAFAARDNVSFVDSPRVFRLKGLLYHKPQSISGWLLPFCSMQIGLFAFLQMEYSCSRPGLNGFFVAARSTERKDGRTPLEPVCRWRDVESVCTGEGNATSNSAQRPLTDDNEIPT